MRVGICTMSLPLKWWNDTVIAHNRIFSYLALALVGQGHLIHIINTVDDKTKTSIHINCRGTTFAQDGKVCSLDSVIVFCGPHMPVTHGGITHQTISFLAGYEGPAAYVTCDYLLQFDFNISRYGPLFKNYADDALFANKDWAYVLHGPKAHHFKTEAQLAKVAAHVPEEMFFEVPLNKSGIRDAALKTKLGRFFKTGGKPVVDLVYCGAYREKRVKFFKQFFCNKAAAGWIVSTSQKNQRKFQALTGWRPRVVGPHPNGVWDAIAKAWAQIIVNDDTDKYAPLPTRFWEACSAGVPAFFHFESEKDSFAGREWDWLVSNSPASLFVSGPDELADRITAFKTNSEFRDAMVAKQNEMIEGFAPFVEWKVAEWL